MTELTRGTYRWDARLMKLVPLEEWYATRRNGKRSDLPTPAVIGDNIEVRSMADGEMYTSKSRLRRSYRQKGFVEVGDAPLPDPVRKGPDRKAIQESVGRAFSRVGIPV